MRTRRWVGSVGSVALLLVASACSSDDDGRSPSPSADDTSIDAPAGLVQDGVLTVCSDLPRAPFALAGARGEDAGVDLDLLRAMADDVGLEVTVIDVPFDGILGHVAAGDCDVAASAISITPQLAEQVDFSKPYYDSAQSLLVRTEDKDTYATLVGLMGQRIGVQSGSAGAAYATTHTPEGAELVSFADTDAMDAALATKAVAALLQDLPLNQYRASRDPGVALVETFTTSEQYGFAVEKGDGDMTAFLDAGLARLRRDGRFGATVATYLSVDGGGGG